MNVIGPECSLGFSFSIEIKHIRLTANCWASHWVVQV